MRNLISRHQPIMFILMLLALAGVLFFGLRPKEYNFANNVSLTDEGGGLHFEKYSMAYTRVFETQMVGELVNSTGLSVFLNFRPELDFDDGFGLIVVMHDGDNENQMIIGQWKTHIIAMNGDDYAHKRGVPRIALDISKYLGLVESEIVESRIEKSRIDKSGSELQLILTSGRKGTRLYVDGKLVKEKPNIMLKVPAGEGARMILGSSPYGNASWRGDIYGLALYSGAVSAEDIKSIWKDTSGKAYPKAKGNVEQLLSYEFKAIEGNKVKDLSLNKIDLHIPKSVVPLKKRILALPRPGFEVDKRFFMDVGLNFLGFVPLGFLLAVVLMQSGSLAGKQAVWVTVISCLVLSLGIEIAQAWLPSRDSSLLDLVMNTMGAGGGAFLSDRIYPGETKDKTGFTGQA